MEKIKLKTIIIFTFLIFAYQLTGQNRSVYISKINTAHKCIVEKKYENALNLYMEAFACKVSQNPIHWYEASSLAAKLKYEKLSFIFLNQSIVYGFSFYERFKNNSNFSLDSIKKNYYLEQIKKQDDLLIYLTSLLDTIFQKDQNIRSEYSLNKTKENLNKINKIDAENLNVVKNIISLYGFWGLSLKTPSAKFSMYTVITHAPVEIQEQYLPLLEKAVDRGELRDSDLAYIKDKISYYRLGYQKYGTQYHIKKGKIQLLSLQNIDSVDIWRKEIGLNTIHEYIKSLEGY